MNSNEEAALERIEAAIDEMWEQLNIQNRILRSLIGGEE